MLKAYRGQIMHKLGVASVAELARLAQKADISLARESPASETTLIVLRCILSQGTIDAPRTIQYTILDRQETDWLLNIPRRYWRRVRAGTMS